MNYWQLLGSLAGRRARLQRRVTACFAAAALAAAWPALSAEQGGDARPIPFEHLTAGDGLPQGTVHSTVEDSQGFIWIGTEDGLVRFDGREVYRYAHSPRDRAGLPGSFVQKIVEDAKHDLWIALPGAGVAHWSRATDTFRVYGHARNSSHGLSSDNVSAIAFDPQGRLWIGTKDTGIDVLDPATEKVTHIGHDSKVLDSLRSEHVTALLWDATSTLWVGTETGLDRLKQSGQGFVHIDSLRGAADTEVRQIVRDRSGSIWVATDGAGLIRLDAAGNLERAYRHSASDSASLASDVVRTVLEDSEGHIWIGTADGLDLLDRRSNHLAHYRHDARDPASLRDSDILSLYEGTGGLMWVGTRSGGVSRWNRHGWELGAQRPDWLAGGGVTAFADGPGRSLWVASLGRGLARLDPETGAWTSIDTVVGRHDALGEGNVMAVHLDRHGSLWIGTMKNGLKTLAADGHLSSFPVRPGDPYATSAAGVQTIYEAGDGRLWVGLHGGGVNIVDPESGRVVQLPYAKDEPGAISAPDVTAIAQDQTGNFWVGTESGGLNLVDRNGRVQRVFRHDPDDPTSLSSNTVYALMVDSEGRVWVTPESGGLQQIAGTSNAPNTIRFMSMATGGTLGSDQIYGVLEDTTGRLWLSGNAGLTRYDPRDRSVKSFHVEQGAQGEEFNYNAYHQLRDGRLCFGGPGGFNVFDPTKLTEHAEPPRVALTSIAVMGRPIDHELPYWEIDHIDLSADASIVSLDFAALDFTSIKRNQLSYRMAGLTDTWIDLGTQTRITLTNLEPGDHVLEVRGASRNSGWSKSPLRLQIHRAPPVWRSPLFYASYALLSLASIAWLLHLQRNRTRATLQARARLEAEVAARTRDLQETNRELQLAAQARSSILARMSHELRTPMNGVVGMTELLLRTPQSTAQERLTRTIRSSADLLLQILNDLLDLSKAQADKIKLESLPLDIGLILEESAALFTGAAREKTIDLVVCPPLVPTRTVLGDPLRIRQILLNLIGNAVKFTDYGEVVACADIEQINDDRAQLVLTVTDTGIGMDPDAIERVFEPFAQADESTTRRFGGTGLGLAICRELSRLMDGTITVESSPGRGSKFTVKLQLTSAGIEVGTLAKVPLRGSVVILSHSQSLADALSRQISNFGLRRMSPSGGLADPFVGAGALIVDASTHAPDLHKFVAESDPRLSSLVVIATAAEAAALGLSARLSPAQIVARPVPRDALYSAIYYASHGTHDVLAGDTSSTSTRLPVMRGHVLVVEDDAVNAEVAQGYLEALGCSSVWVQSGALALERFTTDSYDLVLMDLNMPDMDGFETARRMRALGESRRRIPIVALTAHDRARFGDACTLAGMDDILTKPYTFDGCASMLRRWLGPTGDQLDTAGERPAPVLLGAADYDSLDVVDPAIAHRLHAVVAKGAASLYARLTELFCSISPAELERLNGALACGDLATAGAICHRLRASSGNLGALAFSCAVGELEERCQAGDLEGALAINMRVTRAHPYLLAAIRANLLRASA